MPATAAERQRASRGRRAAAGAVRVDVQLSKPAADALGRLARHRGLTVRQTLEQIIGAAETETVAGLGFLVRPGYFA